MRLFGRPMWGHSYYEQRTTPPCVDSDFSELLALCREIEQDAKERKMKNCKTCGQTLPKREAQGRDIVQISMTGGSAADPRFGMVLEPVLADLLSNHFGQTLRGYVRVLHLNGPSVGYTGQYSADRLTVVEGVFRVTERL